MKQSSFPSSQSLRVIAIIFDILAGIAAIGAVSLWSSVEVGSYYSRSEFSPIGLISALSIGFFAVMVHFVLCAIARVIDATNPSALPEETKMASTLQNLPPELLLAELYPTLDKVKLCIKNPNSKMIFNIRVEMRFYSNEKQQIDTLQTKLESSILGRESKNFVVRLQERDAEEQVVSVDVVIVGYTFYETKEIITINADQLLWKTCDF